MISLPVTRIYQNLSLQTRLQKKIQVKKTLKIFEKNIDIKECIKKLADFDELKNYRITE
jgi:hypothetical protein